jgi:hypothetical protein
MRMRGPDAAGTVAFSGSSRRDDRRDMSRHFGMRPWALYVLRAF